MNSPIKKKKNEGCELKDLVAGYECWILYCILTFKRCLLKTQMYMPESLFLFSFFFSFPDFIPKHQLPSLYCHLDLRLCYNSTNCTVLAIFMFHGRTSKTRIFDGRFYDLVDGILKKGRQIFLTGCYLRAASGGSGHPRLLPTEYLIILLDEVVKNDFSNYHNQYYISLAYTRLVSSVYCRKKTMM